MSERQASSVGTGDIYEPDYPVIVVV